MNTAPLTKQQIVLHLKCATNDGVILNDPWSNRSIVLAAIDWNDMGRPLEVTVTIEPGDLLNP